MSPESHTTPTVQQQGQYIHFRAHFLHLDPEPDQLHCDIHLGWERTPEMVAQSIRSLVQQRVREFYSARDHGHAYPQLCDVTFDILTMTGLICHGTHGRFTVEQIPDFNHPPPEYPDDLTIEAARDALTRGDDPLDHMPKPSPSSKDNQHAE